MLCGHGVMQQRYNRTHKEHVYCWSLANWIIIVNIIILFRLQRVFPDYHIMWIVCETLLSLLLQIIAILLDYHYTLIISYDA